MHDVAVIGAGPAGIAAATEAAEAGMDVLLIDAAPRPGGQIWRHVSRRELPAAAQAWLQRLDRSGAQICAGTTLIDAVCNAAEEGLTLHIAAPHDEVVQARTLVVATGARELFLPFPGWTLPGVMGVGGVQALLKSGATMKGRRIVLAGTGPLMLPVAAALADSGAKVTHVLEQADTLRVAAFAAGLWRTPQRLLQALRYRARALDSRWRTGTWITEAHGGERVTHATITDGHSTRRVPCDLLCVGYGLVPATEVAMLLDCAIENGAVVVNEQQRTSVPGVYCAGEPTGVAGVDAAIAEGRIAAHWLTESLSHSRNGAAVGRKAALRVLIEHLAGERRFAGKLNDAFTLRPALKTLARDHTIVCRCEDVTLGEVRCCGSMREAKLHTRAGMGPCQGRVCGPALKHLLGWNDDTIRPPIFPASVHAMLAVDQSAAT